MMSINFFFFIQSSFFFCSCVPITCKMFDATNFFFFFLSFFFWENFSSLRNSYFFFLIFCVTFKFGHQGHTSLIQLLFDLITSSSIYENILFEYLPWSVQGLVPNQIVWIDQSDMSFKYYFSFFSSALHHF